MSIFRWLVLAGLSLFCGVLAEGARADEVYTCEGGRLIYVKPGELTALLQREPCLAAYYPSAQLRPAAAVDVAPVAPTPARAAPAPAAPASKKPGSVRLAPPPTIATGVVVLNGDHISPVR